MPDTWYGVFDDRGRLVDCRETEWRAKFFADNLPIPDAKTGVVKKFTVKPVKIEANA